MRHAEAPIYRQAKNLLSAIDEPRWVACGVFFSCCARFLRCGNCEKAPKAKLVSGLLPRFSPAVASVTLCRQAERKGSELRCLPMLASACSTTSERPTISLHLTQSCSSFSSLAAICDCTRRQIARACHTFICLPNRARLRTPYSLLHLLQTQELLYDLSNGPSGTCISRYIRKVTGPSLRH